MCRERGRTGRTERLAFIYIDVRRSSVEVEEGELCIYIGQCFLG
jgi:hypothetical protein